MHQVDAVAGLVQREHEVHGGPLVRGTRVVVAGVATPGLLPLQRCLGDALGDDQHVAQVHRQVPAGVVLAVPLDAEVLGAFLELLDHREGLGQLLLGPDDADQVLHVRLEVLVDRVRVLAAAAVLERREREVLRREDVLVTNGGRLARRLRCARRGGLAGAASEDEQVRQRVAAEPVRAVHAARALAHGVQAWYAALLGVRVHLDAAHHVVAGGPDLHRLLGDVDVGQLLELVVHRRQPLADVLGVTPRGDVEEDAAVR